MRSACWTVMATLGLLICHDNRARALDPDVVDKAIDRGVKALRKMQTGGTWPHREIGATALAGLTLLECGASADDRAVRSAADAVRQQCPSLDTTYSIALAILFLDRLGDANDLPLIDSLTIRLIAGQIKDRGWAYKCPILDGDGEVKRLKAYLKDRPDTPRERPTKRTVENLAKESRAQLVRLARGEGRYVPPSGEYCDNSNTQFALVALWAGRRHGLPVDDTIASVAAYLRKTQKADGGWAYMPEGSLSDQSTATMTCAGLLGVAIDFGSKAEVIREKGARLKLNVAGDEALRRGLTALATCIDHPASKRRALAPKVSGTAYYFLWGLERVAVALDVDTIGGKDWYTWGAEILLVSQEDDGSWKGEYGECGADTCFALLFLRRANMYRDLTASIKGHLNDKPELRSGGLGGKNLVEGKDVGKIRPGITPKDEPAKTKPDPMDTRDSASRTLARELLEAPSSKWDGVLDRLRDGKGVVYTEALAQAIPELTGADKRKAREALSDRLTRMSAETLSKYLKDRDTEVRRAAAWACACKESKAHIPELIGLLDDREATVAYTAHAALKELTGQKFPFDPKDRAKAIAQWKQWWAKQQPS